MIKWNDALEQCKVIVDLIDNDVPDHAWDKASTFFEGIRDKVAGISEWIEENEHVTKKMAESLDNMERGVKKWIKD
jgi:hypothetical protein